MRYQFKKISKNVFRVILGMFILSFIAMVFTVENLSSYSNEVVDMVAKVSREEHINDVVNNVISKIESIEENVIYRHRFLLEFLSDKILKDVDNDIKYIDDWNKKIVNASEEVVIHYVVYDVNTYEYIKGNCKEDKFNNYLSAKQQIEENSSVFYEFGVNSYRYILFINYDYIYDVVKGDIYDDIYSRKYSNGEYIWIDEIIDYNGGDNFAIRLINPNVSETEGSYLSTNTQDIKGNYPYRDELEGVKENGEVYLSYYFKTLGTDKIEKKYSYVKLYEKYNWIIGMGTPESSMYRYSHAIQEYTRNVTVDVLIFAGVIFILVVLVGIFVLSKIQKISVSEIEEVIHLESDIDSLTEVYNRKFCVKCLENEFQKFQLSKKASLIIMFDIDSFKTINDTYGHDMGDIVLKDIVEITQKSMRSSDKLYRWGGEEFIIISSGLSFENAKVFTDNILNNIKSHKFRLGDLEFNVTISMGGSMFVESDIEFSQAIKRADEALYYSKNNGKNQYNAKK